MSHFTVIVFGKDPAKQLQPYHEFECTGQDDKYVQDIDETEKLRKEYETMTTTRYKDAEGNLFVTWADQFYREPTAEELEKHRPMDMGCGGGISWTSKDWGDGKGYRPKIAYIPAGYTKVEVKQSAVMTFAEYCTEYEGKTALKPGETLALNEKHKYGYCSIDDKGEVVKVIDRTNPNAKWDWWIVGGRWSGFFKLKEGAEGVLGKKGVGGANRNHKPGYADIAKKKDIDFASMEETAAKKAAEIYDKVAAIVPEISWESWESVCARIKNINEARDFYNNQPAIKAIVESKEFGFYFEQDELLAGREAYIEAAKTESYRPYAFVKDGKWFGKGRMAWWGASYDEDEVAYNKLFLETLKSATPNTILTVVDCHI